MPRRPRGSDDHDRIAMNRSTVQHDAVADGKIGGRNPTSRRETAERKKVKRYLTAQYAITDLLADADTLEAALPKVLRTLCAAALWDVGELWILDPSAKVLRCVGIVSTRRAAGPECATFTRISREMTFWSGEGFIGSIWPNSKPLWIDNLAADARFQRRPAAASAGLTSAVGVPGVMGVKGLGGLVLFTKKGFASA